MSYKYMRVGQQRFLRWTLAVMACLALVALPTYGGKAASPLSPILEELRTQVILDQGYTVGSELTLELPMGKAARLEVQDNVFGLKEVVLCPRNEVLYQYCVWTSGEISGGGKTLKAGYHFSIHMPADKLGFVVEWEIAGEKIRIHYRTVTDEAEILRAKEKKRDTQVRLEQERLAAGTSSTLPRDERIAGFARLWSEVKYNFVGFDRVPALDWDQVLTEYLPRVEETEQVDAYHRVLQECLARLKDGHTDVSLNWPTACPPFWAGCIEGKAVVTETLGEPEIKLLPAAAREEIEHARVIVGEEVTQIDGRSVAQVLESDIYPLISASTSQERDWKAFRRLLCGDVGSHIALQLKGIDGTTREVVFTRSFYWSSIKPTFEHRELDGGMDYVALRSFESERTEKSFVALCDERRNSRGLIIDIRENGGGDDAVGYAVVARLIDAPVKTLKWSARQHVSAFYAWGQEETSYEGQPDEIAPSSGSTFRGPVVVLIGAGAMSAAEDFVAILHAAKRVTLVGERSTGSTGQPLIVKLPGKAIARICTKRDTYPDGREFVGIGVLPDIEVHSTQADIAAGRDPVLEKGVEVLRHEVERIGKS